LSSCDGGHTCVYRCSPQSTYTAYSRERAMLTRTTAPQVHKTGAADAKQTARRHNEHPQPERSAHRCQLCRWRLWLLPPIAPADVGTSSKDVMARFTGPSLASPAVQALGSGGLDNTPWHPFAATRRRNASAMRCSDACHITQLSMPPRRNATAHVGTHLVGPHRPARLRHLRRDRLGESVCCDIPRGRA